MKTGAKIVGYFNLRHIVIFLSAAVLLFASIATTTQDADGLAGTPDAVDDSLVMYQDSGPVSINWIANDDMDDNATLDSFDSVSTASGSVSDNGDGTFDYDPVAGYSGGDGFTYTICDDDTPTAECDTASVSITVIANSTCLTGFYQTLSGEINILDTSVSPAEYVAAAPDIGELNATGYNPNDGLIYGFSSDRDALISFDPNTGVFDYNVYSHTEDNPFAGDFDSSNNLYYNRSSDTVLWIYNTVTDTRSSVTLPSSHGASDFAYVPSNDLFYGIQAGGDNMAVIDISPLSVNTTALSGPITLESGGFGATWVTGNSNLYAFNNASGNIFSINLSTGASSLVATSSDNGSNDGMSCAAGTDPFNISTILDYGDAPDSYGTLSASSGASAVVNTSYRIGNFNEIDADGQPGANADSDDGDGIGDDEDGVRIGVDSLENAIVYEGESNTISVDVPLNNGYVSLWIDQNDDGDFADAGEQFATDVTPVGGVASLTFTPSETTSTIVNTYARVRLAARAGGGETGLFSFGEVEDYTLQLNPSRPTITNDALSTVSAATDDAYNITGTCTDDGDAVDVAVDDTVTTVNATSTTCSSGTFSVVVDISGLNEGTLTVTSTIDDGINDPATDIDTVSKDSTLPTITQAAASAISDANKALYPVSGTCSADGDAITVTLTDSDAPANTTQTATTCSSGTYSVNLNATGLIDGTVNVDSTIDDGINPTVSDDEDVTKDIVGPTITQNAAVDISDTNKAVYPVSGTCSANSDSVTVTLTDSDGPANTAQSVTTCSAGTYSTTVNATGLVDGTVNVDSTIDDGINPTVSDDEDVTKDVIVPTVTNDSLAAVTVANALSYPVSGTCTQNGDTVVVTISDGSNPDVASGPLTCTSGVYSTNLNITSLSDGGLTVTSDITDSVGNTASDADPTTKDTGAPTITQSAQPDIADANKSSYPVGGTCSANGDSITVTLTDGDAPANTVQTVTTCSSGAYSVNLDATSLIDGTVNVDSTIDDGINPIVSDDEDVSKDTVIPTITHDTLGAVTAANAAAYSVSGVCTQEGDSVVVTISDGSNPNVVGSPETCTSGAYTSVLDVSSLDDGGLTVTSDVSDTFGNSAQDVDPATKDTGAPTISITGPLPDVSSDNISTYPINGTCSAIGDSVSVAVTDGTAAFNAATTCVDDGGSGVFSVTMDILGIAEGTFDVTSTISDGINPDVQDSDQATLPSDLDDDDTSSAEEQAGPNSGDGNNDGMPDYLQDDVTTKINPVVNAYVTTEVAGDCDALTSVNFFVEPDLAVQDGTYEYALGLHGFNATCSTNGGTVTVTHYWDQEYDTTDWIYRKFIDNQYVDFNDQVTYGVENIGGTNVTTVTFSLTDGGPYDADGEANGVIVDPAGPAVLADSLSDTGHAARNILIVGAAIALLPVGLYIRTRRTKTEIAPQK